MITRAKKMQRSTAMHREENHPAACIVNRPCKSSKVPTSGFGEQLSRPRIFPRARHQRRRGTHQGQYRPSRPRPPVYAVASRHRQSMHSQGHAAAPAVILSGRPPRRSIGPGFPGAGMISRCRCVRNACAASGGCPDSPGLRPA